MTKLRLSNHELMIEKGRHSNLAISERKCPFCHLVEDEIHFLVTCNIYSILRNDLLNSVEEKLNVELMIRTDKIVMLKYLLGNIEISPLVAKYITKTMELRNFLMNNPKRVTWYSITVTLLSYWLKSACPYCYFSVVSCGYLCHFFMVVLW